MLVLTCNAPRSVPATSFAEVRKAFDRACHDCGITQDCAARLLGLSPEQLYQQLNGQGHLSQTRLLRAALSPDADARRFVRAYWLAAAEDMGVTEAKDAVTFYRDFTALIERVRMVKADLRPDAARKRA